MTKAIVAAGQPLKITIHDHLIVGREGIASLRQIGAF
jgi:DNA repair protein RadC